MSTPLQTGCVEGKIIPFSNTVQSEIPWPQWAKQSLKLYQALARSVTWEGAWCFVSGGTAQTGDIPVATAQDK